MRPEAFRVVLRPLVTCVARKIRQRPPYTGGSALGEEARNDEVLAKKLRVFQAARFHGFTYLETKRDDRAGRMYIIELNVDRANGRSAIAEVGGVSSSTRCTATSSGCAYEPTRSNARRVSNGSVCVGRCNQLECNGGMGHSVPARSGVIAADRRPLRSSPGATYFDSGSPSPQRRVQRYAT